MAGNIAPVQYSLGDFDDKCSFWIGIEAPLATQNSCSSLQHSYYILQVSKTILTSILKAFSGVLDNISSYRPSQQSNCACMSVFRNEY